jgi:hypothetical protein
MMLASIMNMRFSFWMIVIIGIGFLNSIEASEGSSTILRLTAESDCYVSENNPESAYGKEVVLNVRSYTDGKQRFNHRSYIHFDINKLPINVKVISAILWLYKNPEGANPGIRNILAFKVVDSWNENTLNWNNKPDVSNDPTAYTIVGGSLEWYKWDITEDVKAWYGGITPNYGTMLRDEFENSEIDYASVFLSSEASHPENPILEIDYQSSSIQAKTTQEQVSNFRIPSNTLIFLFLLICIPAILWFIVKNQMKR